MIYILFSRFILLLLLVRVAISAHSVIPITRPGCNDRCKNSSVKIPFPFGIGDNCYHDSWYEIACYSSSVAQKPFLRNFNVEVLNITSCLDMYSCSNDDLMIEVANKWQRICTSDADNGTQHVTQSIDLGGSPFTFSGDYNHFLVVGCPGYVTATSGSGGSIGGCSSTCPDSNATTPQNSSTCDGLGCCYFDARSDDFDVYQINLTKEVTHTCMNVALTNNPYSVDIGSNSSGKFPTWWNWKPPALVTGMSSLQYCVDTPHDDDPLPCTFQNGTLSCEGGCVGGKCTRQICACPEGYEGNPYIPFGCRDPCKDGTIRCEKTKSIKSMKAVLGLSMGLGSLIVLLCSYGLYRLIRRQRRIKQRAKFFKRNGGLLLQQQMTSTKGVVERTKVFTSQELEKATDNFNRNRILGQGGQGTVYKGMLLDGRVVAIKKSKKVDENQLEDFINEVVILSQISHRNVVKLLGCCLETEVPLLVYEFIPNGALSQHLHRPSEDFHISWTMRLQIAAESAGAIAYLHSSSATPIYHRDIKSSNILLDDKYRAKVSDFGTSRTVMIDQTHLTTCVQGTFGYLDPEYFQSNQFTEKSDVYSFGVVLIELLTSKKPLTPTESGGWKSLATQFLFHMEFSSLFDIMDSQVLEEAKEDEVMAIANLAKQCLNLNGKRRPTMKAVAITLEGIRSPNQPTIQEEQAKPKGDKMMMKVNKIHSSNPFFSENDIGASHFVEIQPLVYNTV